MAIVIKSVLVPYSAEQMYTLVNDFESYPRFLPWCESARMISRTEDEMCAELVVSRVGIRQKFSTCNQLQKNERIEIHLNEGPFRRLHGGWVFTRLGDAGCKVELHLEFEFSGRLIEKAFGAVFSQIANSLVDAFCKRADEVYRD